MNIFDIFIRWKFHFRIYSYSYSVENLIFVLHWAPPLYESVCACVSFPKILCFSANSPCAILRTPSWLRHRDTRTLGDWYTGTLGHQVTRTLGHRDIRTQVHFGTGTQGHLVPTYYNRVVIFLLCWCTNKPESLQLSNLIWWILLLFEFD